MKKAGTYIFSFLLSILLIFTVIGSIGCSTAKTFADPDKLYDTAKTAGTSKIVRNELEKYFTENYNNTAIPAEVYMNVIDSSTSDIIDYTVYMSIANGFDVLRGKENADIPSSIDLSELDSAIAKYYSDYADSIGYTKDEKYDEKLSKAKLSARRIIADRCDVYKFSALASRGVLKKAIPVYKRITLLLAMALGAAAVTALLLLLVNIKEKRTFLYWLGASSLVAGILGAVPCIYLTATDYFSAFTIKQPQIYAAYTTLMRAVTDRLMISFIAAAVIGICLIIAYSVICKAVGNDDNKEKKPSEKTE